ncbi:MAG: MFS transporter [Candidatus Cybelea sp.]
MSATFFMLLVDFSIVSIALPSMERELHMRAAQGQWIVSTYAIFLAGFLMLTGRCADIYGRFHFFVVGLIVFTLASLLGGMAHTGAILVTMRAIQGFGAALVNPAALSIALSLFPSGPQRSRAVAMWGTVGTTGVAAGTLFGGILVQYLGWRSVLFVNVPVAALILAFAPFYIPRDRGDVTHRRLDVLGAFLLTATLVVFVYTVESVPVAGWASMASVAGIAATAVFLALFIAVERRVSEPILPARILRYPDLLSGASVVLLQPMSYAGVFVFGSVYLQRVAGFDPLVAGLAFLPSTLVTAAIAAPLTMPIARLLGVRRMGIVMGAMMVTGEAMLLFMQPGSAWKIFLVATCIAAFGGMLAYQSGMIAGLAHVEDADEGTASAVQSFALQLGIGLSVAFGAAAQEARTSMILRTGASPAQALAGGLQAAFFFLIVAGLAMIVAIVCGLRHAGAAEIPLRHYLPFGKLHHRISVRT